MLTFLAYVTVVGLAIGATAVVAVVALSRALGGSIWPAWAAGTLLVVGAVPPSILGILWYALIADYEWAISGPGVFGHLGGGPTMLTAFALTALWTSTCWTAAIWIARRLAKQA